jgi:hypothetical protein
MKKSKQINYKKIECPICLRRIKYKIETNCMHTFCDICIVKHLMNKNTCPMCRTKCDYEYVTTQIRVKRQKYLMKKLLPPVTSNSTYIMREPIQPMSVYSRFIPQHLPASIIMISLFTVEVCIVIYIVVVITQNVMTML